MASTFHPSALHGRRGSTIGRDKIPGRPVFLLGVGCQKGGTTWLHDYLQSHPQVNLGFTKEYHVFDVLHNVPGCGHFRHYYESRARQQRELRGDGQPIDPGLEKQLGFYDSTASYYDYFKELVQEKPETRLVGDITPSYAGLPASAFSEIRKQLLERGFSVRVIFLMRDPVERVWSQIRMLRRDRPGDAQFSEVSEAELIRKRYRGLPCAFRTRYELTIQNLESVFPADELHYNFYERLFNDDSIRDISEFLRLEFDAGPPDFSRRINTSEKHEPISRELQQEVAEYYAQTYRYVRHRFGSVVKELWPRTSML